MKIIKTKVHEFKKGKVYSVDGMEVVGKDIFSDYFDPDFDDRECFEEFELGCGLCIKSFSITITIKE